MFKIVLYLQVLSFSRRHFGMNSNQTYEFLILSQLSQQDFLALKMLMARKIFGSYLNDQFISRSQTIIKKALKENKFTIRQSIILKTLIYARNAKEILCNAIEKCVSNFTASQQLQKKDKKLKKIKQKETKPAKNNHVQYINLKIEKNKQFQSMKNSQILKFQNSKKDKQKNQPKEKPRKPNIFSLIFKKILGQDNSAPPLMPSQQQEQILQNGTQKLKKK